MTRTLSIALVAGAALALLGGAAFAGPYTDATHGINYNDPRFVGWATGITMHLPNGFTPFYNDPTKALGAAPGTSNDVVTLGDGGWAVLTFGVTISNRPGPDLAVFENGFNDPAHPGQLFGELAFVEVSSDGTNYARFPSASLNAWPGEYGSIDPTKVYNLAGKNINNNGQAWQGTPFDLSSLANDPLVLAGTVNLNAVHYVKIVDINGDSNGTTYDSAASLIDPTTGTYYTTNHVVHDGGNNGGNLAGFDLDAVGVLAPRRGDANGDGKVDGVDLSLWQINYDPLGVHAATNTFGMGDFNGDGRIDGVDLSLWQQNYSPLGYAGQAVSGDALMASFTEAPEPGSVSLAVIGTLALVELARRRRRRIV